MPYAKRLPGVTLLLVGLFDCELRGEPEDHDCNGRVEQVGGCVFGDHATYGAPV